MNIAFVILVRTNTTMYTKRLDWNHEKVVDGLVRAYRKPDLQPLDWDKLSNKERAALLEHQRKQRDIVAQDQAKRFSRAFEILKKIAPDDDGAILRKYYLEVHELPSDATQISPFEEAAFGWMIDEITTTVPELKTEKMVAIYLFRKGNYYAKFQQRKRQLDELHILGTEVILSEIRYRNKARQDQYSSEFDRLSTELQLTPKEKDDVSRHLAEFREHVRLEEEARRNPRHAAGCWCPNCADEEKKRVLGLK
jgi:hypothetical protein